ncbi:hypothetical protein [Gayadomonas joobiniege]|uniref:hypothetical protein n=1 Tax=Gayadomonas joobiniege TaxID=1234606 RepID=UPI00036287FF|nr:hypothetical protein [Gayadomonas joobiniege]
MKLKNLSLLLVIVTSAVIMGCASNAEPQANKSVAKNQQKTQQTAKKQVKKQPSQNQKMGKNLLAYANPGFEQPLDGNFPKPRAEKSQLNKAEFGPMQEAAKSGKNGLGISLAKGDFKVQYGIWRLRNQIDANKKYRFEFDAFLLEGNAQFFAQVDKSPWLRSPIKNVTQWQVVGTTIDGKHLKNGKPLNMHIDNIKGKETGVLLIDNVRLYEVK